MSLPVEPSSVSRNQDRWGGRMCGRQSDIPSPVAGGRQSGRPRARDAGHPVGHVATSVIGYDLADVDVPAISWPLATATGDDRKGTQLAQHLAQTNQTNCWLTPASRTSGDRVRTVRPMSLAAWTAIPWAVPFHRRRGESRWSLGIAAEASISTPEEWRSVGNEDGVTSSSAWVASRRGTPRQPTSVVSAGVAVHRCRVECEPLQKRGRCQRCLG